MIHGMLVKTYNALQNHIIVQLEIQNQSLLKLYSLYIYPIKNVFFRASAYFSCITLQWIYFTS